MPEHINPAGIPGDNLRPDMVQIGATQMDTIGTEVATQGGTVLTTWQRLALHYEAPESGTLFGVMDPVKTHAETFNTNVDLVSSALKTYAAEVEPIKAELAKIKTEAQDFVTSIAGGVDKTSVSRAGVHHSTIEWHEDQDSVDKNNELIGRVNAQMVLLWAAERKCANAIYDIIGFPHVEAATNDNPNGYGVTEIAEGTETPWGAAVERTESCGEKVAGGVKSFVWDGVIVGGIWGTVVGLGSLTLGYNPQTGEWFDGSTYGAAWSNMGMLAFGLATAGPVGIAGSAVPGPVGDFFRGGQDAVVNAGKGLIAFDKWGDDPWAAAGEATFNIASIVVPVGAATAPVRTSASTAAAAIRTTAKVIDLTDPASLVIKGGTAATRLTLPVLADLSRTLDLSSLDNLGTGGRIDLPEINLRDTPTVEIPGVNRNDMTVDTPNVAGPSDVPVRTPEPVTVPVREPALVGAGDNATPGAGGTTTPNGGSSGSPSTGGGSDLPSGGDRPGLGGEHQPPTDPTPGSGAPGNDPGAPYGRDGNGQPLTKSEFDQSYTDANGQPVYDHPTGTGAVDGPNTGTIDQPNSGTIDHPNSGTVDQPNSGSIDQPGAGGVDQPQHPGSGAPGLTDREVSLNADGRTPELLHRNIEPNTRYVVDNGTYVFETDSAGRVNYAEGHLHQTLDEADRVRNDTQQRNAGGSDRIKGVDDGGHFFAALFGGPPEGINLTAMNGNQINRGAYRSLENLWAREIRLGHSVDVRITVEYSGNARPSQYLVEYSIDGGKPAMRPFPNPTTK